MTAPRNPEGRRAAIVEAACQVIAEVGVGRVTHRLVASRAGVPLGSTTYYFKTLDDLVAAALSHGSDLNEDLLRSWVDAIETTSDLSGTLADLAAAYVADRPQTVLEMELYLAATHRSELKPLARAWLDGLTEVLARHTGEKAAHAVAVMIDGAVLHALIHDRPIDTAELRQVLGVLLDAL